MDTKHDNHLGICIITMIIKMGVRVHHIQSASPKSTNRSEFSSRCPRSFDQRVAESNPRRFAFDQIEGNGHQMSNKEIPFFSGTIIYNLQYVYIYIYIQLCIYIYAHTHRVLSTCARVQTWAHAFIHLTGIQTW